MPHISDRHRLLLNALFVVFLVAPASAQTAQLKYVVDGSAPGARWGGALSSGADLDSDGLTDIVVGTRRGCSFEDYVTAVRGIDGSVLWKRSHLGSNCDHFGTVELIGDLDGDGVSDMVVGAPQANGNRGQAHIISTGSLATLFTISAAGTAPDDRFGSGVGRLGDITGDGVPEFTVAASSADPCCGHYVGTVQAFDGATFAPIWQANGSAGYDYAKQKLGKDINGDGVREVTWHSSQDGFSPQGPGYVRLLDGATGAEMWRVDGDNLEDHFGDQWCLLDDIDGDGVYDFALVVPLGDFFGPNLGEVQVRSGADLTIHYRIPLLPNSGSVGVAGESGGSVCELPDLNGDGAPEFAVGQAYARSSAGDAGTETGALVIVSGADGAILDTLWGENAGDLFGWQVRVMQNFTMVGGLSMVVAAPDYANETGRIYVYELPPPDCNANGVSDALDILQGTSQDCNANGTPDECDVLVPGSDLNGNGVPDECETTLVSVAPDFGAWFEAHTLTLKGTNFDTGLPAEVIFQSFSTPALGDPPLLATVVDASTITVDVPAGHPSGAGLQDVILRQGGVDTTLVDGWKSLPSLQPQLSGDAASGGTLDIVTESKYGGVVYLFDAPQIGAFLLPLDNMHFAFALDFFTAKQVAVGGLLQTPTFSWTFPGGAFPPGLSVFYQGLVIEFPPGGPVISFTETSLMTIP